MACSSGPISAAVPGSIPSNPRATPEIPTLFDGQRLCRPSCIAFPRTGGSISGPGTACGIRATQFDLVAAAELGLAGQRLNRSHPAASEEALHHRPIRIARRVSSAASGSVTNNSADPIEDRITDMDGLFEQTLRGKALPNTPAASRRQGRLRPAPRNRNARAGSSRFRLRFAARAQKGPPGDRRRRSAWRMRGEPRTSSLSDTGQDLLLRAE